MYSYCCGHVSPHKRIPSESVQNTRPWGPHVTTLSDSYSLLSRVLFLISRTRLSLLVGRPLQVLLPVEPPGEPRPVSPVGDRIRNFRTRIPLMSLPTSGFLEPLWVPRVPVRRSLDCTPGPVYVHRGEVPPAVRGAVRPCETPPPLEVSVVGREMDTTSWKSSKPP